MRKAKLYNIFRFLALAFSDFVIMVMSLNVAIWISSDFTAPFFSHNEYVWKFGALFAVAGVVIFMAATVYKIMLRYTGLRDVFVVFIAVTAANLIPLICLRITPLRVLTHITNNALFINAIYFERIEIS